MKTRAHRRNSARPFAGILPGGLHLNRLRQRLRPWLEAASTLLYPPTCVGCNVSLAAGTYLCPKCAGQSARIEPPFCTICAQPFCGEIPLHPAFICPDCRERRPAYQYAICSRRHNEIARDLIARFKYNGQHYLRRPLGNWLADALDDPRLQRGSPPEALVPVPLHPRRERERGFNQAEVLCGQLSQRAGLPVWRALLRVRATPSQTALSRQERRTNLRGAIAPARGRPVAGAHLLLVDDVFTTGSTVDECARVLRRAGAASVRVLAVTRRV